MEVEFYLNDPFVDFIDDWGSKIYLLVGGYGSSKSYHIAVKLIKKLASEKRKAMVVREVYDTMRDSCFDLLAEVADSLGFSEKQVQFLSSPMRVRFSNGSMIIFKGMDKPEKMKSLNGVSIVWVEECSEVKYAGYKEILGRLRHPTKSNHILLSTNPVSKANWVYTHFFEDKNKKTKVLDAEELYIKRNLVIGNTYYHHSTVDDNYFVPDDYRKQLDEMNLYDPDLYRIAREGRFGTNGKLVLPQFEIISPNDMTIRIRQIRNPIEKNGLDFGFVTSYNALVKTVVDHDNHDLYIYYCYYSRDKTDPEIADDIKEQKGVLIKADHEPKAIKYYNQCGFRIREAKKFPGSRLLYTKKVKRFRHIYCSSECQPVIDELQDLTFAVDKQGEIIEDEFNIDPHTLSAIWYALDDYEVSQLKGSAIRRLG